MKIQKLCQKVFYIYQNQKKIRFEYTNPFKSLLIVNKNITTFYDIDLDEISNIPTNSTPLSFLLKNNSNLETTNSIILNVENNDDFIIINTYTYIENNKYYIIYTFDKDIKTLKSINFKNDDAQLNITINLFNSEKNITLNKNLFIFKNPRLYKNRK